MPQEVTSDKHRVQRWENSLCQEAKERLFSQKIMQSLKKYPQRVKQQDIQYLTEPNAGNSLYIFGPVGSGKTILAAALLLECFRFGFCCSKKYFINDFDFVSVPKLLQEIKATFSPTYTGKTEKEISDHYSSVEYLVLDDLGAEKTTEWTLQTLYVIIDSRYNNLKPTIFTSNLDLNQLSEVFGNERIPSRINGMCNQLHLDGIDNRKRSRKK